MLKSVICLLIVTNVHYIQMCKQTPSISPVFPALFHRRRLLLDYQSEKTMTNKREGYPSIYRKFICNLNKMVRISFWVYYSVRPFLWKLLSSYTNSIHAPWDVRGLSKHNDQSRDSVLWSRLEFGSTRHIAMNTFSRLCCIRLIILSQCLSSPLCTECSTHFTNHLLY